MKNESHIIEDQWNIYGKICLFDDLELHPSVLKWQKRSFYMGAYVALKLLRTNGMRLNRSRLNNFINGLFVEIVEWNEGQVAKDIIDLAKTN